MSTSFSPNASGAAIELATKSLLPEHTENTSWGMWGYSGACVDRSIRQDNPEMLSECIDRGYVDIDTRMVNGTVLEWCDLRAPKCAAVLRERAEESKQIPPAAAGF